MNARALLYSALPLVMLAAIARPGVAETRTPPDAQPQLDLKDRFLVLDVDHSSAVAKEVRTVLLRDARIVAVGDRYFVLGTVARGAGQDDPCVGAKAGYAWDNVLSFTLMNPQQFDAYLEYWEKHEE